MKNVCITILAVLVLGLGGYLVYDKVIDKKEDKCVDDTKVIENVTENSSNIQNNETTISYSNIKGNYEYKATFDYAGGKSAATVTYELNENGTFLYKTFGEGAIGNYIIENGEVKINYLFKAGNGGTYEPTEEVETLKIDSDGNLIKGKLIIGGSTFEDVTFSKVSESLNKFNDTMYNGHIYNNYYKDHCNCTCNG